MDTTTWSETISTSFQNAWNTVIVFLPNLLAAILILVIGVLIAAALGRLVKKVLVLMKFDRLMDSLRVNPFLRRFDVHLSTAGILAWLVKWFLIFVVIVAAAEALGLEQITAFINSVLLYIPNVFAAVIILLLGIAAANFVENVIVKSTTTIRSQSATFLGLLAKWAIVIFSFLIALVQLRIAPSLINTVLAGFVFMIALAGGLAFGLGGKEVARELLEVLARDVRNNKKEQ